MSEIVSHKEEIVSHNRNNKFILGVAMVCFMFMAIAITGTWPHKRPRRILVPKVMVQTGGPKQMYLLVPGFIVFVLTGMML